MHRSAPRLSRILACAAVPVMLVAAGCSSDAEGDKDAKSAKPTPSVSAEPTVKPAAFSKLPEPCKSVKKKTVDSLVPEAKDKSGTADKSNDVSARGGCAWNGLDSKGVDGSQYRWLSVSFMRYDSDPSRGPGDKLAEEYYAKQVDAAKATEGAKKVTAKPASGVGDQATAVTYDLRKTDADFKYATVVTRTENVVATVVYNGAGYQGAKSPKAADLLKDAQKAAKEAADSVTAANK
ncbi:DUF3558 domain-containing protein [Streptomyces albidochromogenes]|uniref:DUF3558 domain-containing protein n=1 Tax=Streptomyces albidochromogenes TaxID=329524 RepID=UPI00110FB723|nr:DUF3558 domain-containing protein [Streptomyces albidochromogenes]